MNRTAVLFSTQKPTADDDDDDDEALEDYAIPNDCCDVVPDEHNNRDLPTSDISMEDDKAS